MKARSMVRGFCGGRETRGRSPMKIEEEQFESSIWRRTFTTFLCRRRTGMRMNMP